MPSSIILSMNQFYFKRLYLVCLYSVLFLSPHPPAAFFLLIHLNGVSFCSICIQMAVRGIYGNNISAFIIVYLVTCANFQKMNLSSILAKERVRVKHQPLQGYKAMSSQTSIPINDFLAQLMYLCLVF